MEYLLIMWIQGKGLSFIKFQVENVDSKSSSHADSLKNLLTWLKISISTFLVGPEFTPRVYIYTYTSMWLLFHFISVYVSFFVYILWVSCLMSSHYLTTLSYCFQNLTDFVS